MSDEIITKRLHVSGLTPAISPSDLSARLGGFGTVKALDGFGVLNAVGEPRKFGYVTLETTKVKLARCMNLLSGVTWKGAKLRIGEAKPDFRERIAKEHEPPLDTDGSPRKKRRLAKGIQGVHAEDMSLVTPDNVHTRGGWRVTPLGRIVRPIRMRPEHPLPEPLEKTSAAKRQVKKDAMGKERKRKRVKEPPTRARKRTIDPTKWDSQHLKGAFLDGVVVPTFTQRMPAVAVAEEQDEEESDESSGEIEEEEEIPRPVTHVTELPVVQETLANAPLKEAVTTIPAPKSDLREESKNTIGFLQSLFGDRDEDWGGAESVSSDVEMDVAVNAQSPDTDDVEIVPRQREPDIPRGESVPGVVDDDVGPSEDEEEDPAPVSPGQAQPQVQKTKLKDLFAPREEEAGFSLLGHLDLEDDLDLDEDILGLNLGPSEPVPAATIASLPVVAPALKRFQASDFSTDATHPLFFPMAADDRGAQRVRIKDPLDVARENGWDWRLFRRTETDDEIRKRWEDTKGELTQDWKRRHREAVKSRRRRGGLGGEDHD